MRSHDETFAVLARSAFRRKFHLVGKERAFVEMWGIERVMRDADRILAERVAAAEPKNDGRQTPWRNHPVFVAQHATATCCRGCIEKNWEIAKGHRLTPDEATHLLGAIRRWIESEMEKPVR